MKVVVTNSTKTKKIVFIKDSYILHFQFNSILKFEVNKSYIATIDSFYPFNNANSYLTFYNKILKSFYIFLIKKIKFDGKGYYLYKNKRNALGLQFNYSHRFKFSKKS
jgi:hypothetical protein